MEIIPLITLKRRTILDTNQKTSETKEIKQLPEDEKIYILDLDGIEKDKPNLCLFQNISNKYNLWIDSQPVDLGDTVDSFMAGASSITIRKNLLHKISFEEIRDITENKIFLEINLKDFEELKEKKHILEKADGFVIFNDKDLIECNLKYDNFLKEISHIKNTYIYEKNPSNIKYWQNKGIYGLLVDIEKIKEFKNKWQMMQKS